MTEIDTVIYKHYLESTKEQLTFSITFTRMEPKEAFMVRMDYMWETMQDAVKRRELRKWALPVDRV